MRDLILPSLQLSKSLFQVSLLPLGLEAYPLYNAARDRAIVNLVFVFMNSNHNVYTSAMVWEVITLVEGKPLVHANGEGWKGAGSVLEVSASEFLGLGSGFSE